MRCNNCNKNLDRSWSYCPYCGDKVSMMDEMFGFSREMEKMFQSFGFPKIKIMVRGPGETGQGTQISFAEGVPRQQPRPRRINRTVNQVLEPETKLENGEGYQKLIIKLPGVRNISDIKVKKLAESLEIRAYFEDKMYFKVIPITANSKIIENKFVNEMLKLILTNSAQ